MDFGRAFTYVFDDPDWLRKIGIAALIFLIPFIGQMIVLGWSLRITRRVINGETNVLPNIDFAEDLGLGFQAFVVSLVYALPMILLTLPSALVGELFYTTGQEDVITTLGVVLTLCLTFFAVLYGIFIAVLLPAAYANMVAHDSIAAGLRFGEVFDLLKRNPGAYLVVLGGTIVTGFIAPLGMIACLIGAVITGVYAWAVNGHLYGQAYRATRGAESAAPLARL